MKLALASEARAAVDRAGASRAPVDLEGIGAPGGGDDWSLAPDALRFLARLVAEVRPARIVEFGSGCSTRVLARAVPDQRRPTVIALENDPVFAAATRSGLAIEGHSGRARVVVTPVVVRRRHGRHVPVYLLDEKTVRLCRGAALFVVDGPPLPLGGREGSLIQAVHLAVAGSVVVLDDADRPSERAALGRISELFGDKVEAVRLSGFDKGLVALVVNRGIDGPGGT